MQKTPPGPEAAIRKGTKGQTEITVPNPRKGRYTITKRSRRSKRIRTRIFGDRRF